MSITMKEGKHAEKMCQLCQNCTGSYSGCRDVLRRILIPSLSNLGIFVPFYILESLAQALASRGYLYIQKVVQIHGEMCRTHHNICVSSRWNRRVCWHRFHGNILRS